MGRFLGPCAQAHGQGGHVHRDMVPVFRCLSCAYGQTTPHGHGHGATAPFSPSHGLYFSAVRAFLGPIQK